MIRKDLIGKKFGKLEVISFHSKNRIIFVTAKSIERNLKGINNLKIFSDEVPNAKELSQFKGDYIGGFYSERG